MSLAQKAAVGSFAAFFSATAICPFELLKVRMQCSRGVAEHRTVTLWSCATDVVATEGFRGLFRGLAPLLWRDVPYGGIFFGARSSPIVRHGHCGDRVL
ncbi:MAG: MC/SLC25 family protein [Rhodospirillaceae bacterium]|nr:MC/SLC25 family protein [Rhodospirillaceae bacterium]